MQKSVGHGGVNRGSVLSDFVGMIFYYPVGGTQCLKKPQQCSLLMIIKQNTSKTNQLGSKFCPIYKAFQELSN